MTASDPLLIALADAANNCAREGAIAVLTLRSGVQFEGELDRDGNNSFPGTAHIRTAGGGWVTVDRSEIAAVESRRR